MGSSPWVKHTPARQTWPALTLGLLLCPGTLLLPRHTSLPPPPPLGKGSAHKNKLQPDTPACSHKSAGAAGSVHSQEGWSSKERMEPRLSCEGGSASSKLLKLPEEPCQLQQCCHRGAVTAHGRPTCTKWHAKKSASSYGGGGFAFSGQTAYP